LSRLAEARPGPVVRYEELMADPAAVLAELYEWLWSDVGAERTISLAARAVEMTRRDRRRSSQSGPFLSDTTLDGELIEERDTLTDEAREAIDECRRLNRELARLAVQ
jgi:hypothetical protein